MQVATGHRHSNISDQALARHFVAIAKQTALEGDRLLAQHFLDLAYDLFDVEPPVVTAGSNALVDNTNSCCY